MVYDRPPEHHVRQQVAENSMIEKTSATKPSKDKNVRMHVHLDSTDDWYSSMGTTITLYASSCSDLVNCSMLPNL